MTDAQLHLPAQPDLQVALKRLTDLCQGEISQVAAIRERTTETGQALRAFGIFPGASIRVVENHNHHIIVQVNHRKIAMEKAVSDQIFVR